MKYVPKALVFVEYQAVTADCENLKTFKDNLLAIRKGYVIMQKVRLSFQARRILIWLMLSAAIASHAVLAQMPALQVLSQWAMSTMRLIRISAFHAELALTPAPQALFPRNRMSTVHSKSLLQCVCFAAGSLALYAFWRT